MQVDNLRTQRDAGVTLMIGSDRGELNVVDELFYLEGLGVFGTAELLRMVTMDTPRAIFPGRDLGRLQPGTEASFVVLDADPLVDLGNIGAIHQRVKQGGELSVGSTR